jgi:hypothetical protein
MAVDEDPDQARTLKADRLGKLIHRHPRDRPNRRRSVRSASGITVSGRRRRPQERASPNSLPLPQGEKSPEGPSSAMLGLLRRCGERGPQVYGVELPKLALSDGHQSISAEARPIGRAEGGYRGAAGQGQGIRDTEEIFFFARATFSATELPSRCVSPRPRSAPRRCWRRRRNRACSKLAATATAH